MDNNDLYFIADLLCFLVFTIAYLSQPPAH